MANYRNYSDDDKAQALAFLAAHRGNYKLASKTLGIPWQTLRNWYKRENVTTEVVQKGNEKKIALADLWEESARRWLGIAKEQEDEATFMQAVTSASIGTEKMNLLRQAAKDGERLSEEDAEAEAVAYLSERGYRVVSGTEKGKPRKGASPTAAGTTNHVPNE